MKPRITVIGSANTVPIVSKPDNAPFGDDDTAAACPTTQVTSFVLDGVPCKVDQYVLREKLGQGGFGAVFRAHDTVAGIDVAVKVLPRVVSRDREELAQVRDNFALVSRLRHPNIANVTHLHLVRSVAAEVSEKTGVVGGDYLVVMDFVKGIELAAYRRSLSNCRMPPSEAVDICSQIAATLDYAHSRKVLHRDIKPSNVMLDEENRVRVLDFGLAAEIRSSVSRVSQADTTTSGTPPYMSPEQWRGRSQGERSDQYALAVLFYELVNTHVPFHSAFRSGEAKAMLHAVLEETPELVPWLTRRQNQILLKALSKRPGERYKSCEAFTNAMARATTRNEKPATPLSRDEDEDWSKRLSRKQVLSTIATLACILFSVWYVVCKRPALLSRFGENLEHAWATVTERVSSGSGQAESLPTPGTPEEMFALAADCQEGRGVPRDLPMALKLYRRAGNAGHVEAQYRLGVMFAGGEGVMRNPTTAAGWFTKAAAEGHAAAQYELGVLYFSGRGVAKDPATAAEWLTKAAQQGQPDAQHFLGWMYEVGETMPRDLRTASEWYYKASRQGHPKAEADLERILQTLRDSR